MNIRKHMDASQWMLVGPETDENGSVLEAHFFELPADNGNIDFEARSADELILSAITLEGEFVYLDRGNVVCFFGKLKGFAAVQLECPSSFAVRSSMRPRWYEKPDPTPLSLSFSEPKDAGMQDMIRAELRKYLGRLHAEQALASDVSVQELLDDIQNGELDLDDEPEFEFGFGHMEMEEEEPEDEPEEPQDPNPTPPSPSKEGPDKGAVSDDSGGET